MTPDGKLVQRIVADVLARLEQLAGPQAACAAGPGEGEPGTVRLELPVLSAAELERLPEGVRQVVLVPRCVVTPAARDEAARRGIRLLKTAEPARDACSQAVLVVVAEGSAPERKALEQALARAQVRVERVPPVGLASALAELAREVRLGGRRGLVWTPRPPVALCLANRHRGIRAAGGENPRQLKQAAAALAANCLVLGPECGSPWALRNLIQWFATRRLEPLPAELKE